MAIKELTDEQVRTWTLEQKDRWWLTEVYRGDMPQLTLRAALTGMLLGGVLSLTNLYVGAKTGWTLGVGITSVILAFALFKALARVGLAGEFTILENNAMQSIATAAGYMTSPMISSLAAYMMVTGHVLPMYQTIAWIAVLAVLGVLFAFPFKRRFINDEQQPFPEGRAAGIVMDALHHGDARSGLLKAKLLVAFSLLAATVKLLQAAPLLAFIQSQLFFDKVRLSVLALPEYLDGRVADVFGREPTILGTSVKSLTLRPELDLPMVGAGGLMDVRTGFSILLGAGINYALLAPLLIQAGDIVAGPSGKIGFREITFWSLWGGVAMMTTASLVSFFARPALLLGAFGKLFGRRDAGGDVLAHIELPLWVSAVGIPLLGAVVVGMAWSFFGVSPWLSALAIVLVFGFCLIAINSTGLTSITPIGAMGKLTQLIFGVLAPGDKVVNLMSASITGEVASHSANLLSDIKPGYMLGAKPRQQAIGHVLGVIAGALLSVPVFYLVFLKLPVSDLTATTLAAPYAIDAETYPMPAATIWKAVADVLTQGIDKIPPTARLAALVGIVLGLLLEAVRMRTRGRFPLSPVGIGLGFIIPFSTCLSMFVGSFLFWLAGRLYPKPGSKVNEVLVQNQEPICAGLIAGGALMGIAVAVAELFLPSGGH